MNTVDWIALALVGGGALLGLARGLVVTALSLAGLVGGAVLGSRIAPGLLPDGWGRWTWVATIGGAVVGAGLLHGAAALVGRAVRSGLRVTPLGMLDSLAGALLGAAAGAAIAWLLGAAALEVPVSDSWRREVRRSEVLQRLFDLVPASTLSDALARFDPFPRVAAPAVPVAPPTRAVLAVPGVRAAAPSVVRVAGRACGFGITGSGWVAARELVVTAAHVVAGERSTSVLAPGRARELAARVVAFDARNDVAVLRVPGLRARPLPLAAPVSGTPVAILGYPENGPFAAAAGRLGPTARIASEDVYGNRPRLRTMTTIAGRVRHGNSGGPAVDASGTVRATIFGAAKRAGSSLALGVPADIVRAALAGARGRVSTGRCAVG